MCPRIRLCLLLSSLLCAMLAACSEDFYYGGDNPSYSSRKNIYGEWALQFEICDYYSLSQCPQYITDNDRRWFLNDNGKSMYASMSENKFMAYQKSYYDPFKGTVISYEGGASSIMVEPISWELENGNAIRFSYSGWGDWAYGRDGEKLGGLRDFVEKEYLAKHVYNDSDTLYNNATEGKCIDAVRYNKVSKIDAAGEREITYRRCIWTISSFDSLKLLLMRENVGQWELLEARDTASLLHCEIYKDEALGSFPPSYIYANCQPKPTIGDSYLIKDGIRFSLEENDSPGCEVCRMSKLAYIIDTISVSDMWKTFVVEKEDL